MTASENAMPGVSGRGLGGGEGDLVKANPAGIVAVVEELQPLTVPAHDGEQQALMGTDVRLSGLEVPEEVGTSGGDNGRTPGGRREPRSRLSEPRRPSPAQREWWSGLAGACVVVVVEVVVVVATTVVVVELVVTGATGSVSPPWQAAATSATRSEEAEAVHPTRLQGCQTCE